MTALFGGWAGSGFSCRISGGFYSIPCRICRMIRLFLAGYWISGPTLVNRTNHTAHRPHHIATINRLEANTIAIACTNSVTTTLSSPSLPIRDAAHRREEVPSYRILTTTANMDYQPVPHRSRDYLKSGAWRTPWQGPTTSSSDKSPVITTGNLVANPQIMRSAPGSLLLLNISHLSPASLVLWISPVLWSTSLGHGHSVENKSSPTFRESRGTGVHVGPIVS